MGSGPTTVTGGHPGEDRSVSPSKVYVGIATVGHKF